MLGLGHPISHLGVKYWKDFQLSEAHFRKLFFWRILEIESVFDENSYPNLIFRKANRFQRGFIPPLVPLVMPWKSPSNCHFLYPLSPPFGMTSFMDDLQDKKEFGLVDWHWTLNMPIFSNFECLTKKSCKMLIGIWESIEFHMTD